MALDVAPHMGAFNYHMHEIQPRGRLDSDIKRNRSHQNKREK